VLLDGLADGAPGPEARYEAKEAISLAFVTALQLLPPRQRAVLVLCDVVGFPAKQVADTLGSSPDSVTSALKRARATLHRQRPPSARHGPPPAPGSAAERAVVERFTRAYEAGDVAGLVALCTDDVVLTTPHAPDEYVGHGPAARLLATAVFRPGRRLRLIETRANGQPAFGVYFCQPPDTVAHATGLLVLTLAGGRISAMTRFGNSAVAGFGLPPTQPG
jgi:RNA polymerase sigma-70 factor (ECF subfamily)